MRQIKFVLVDPDHLSQILYFLAHHRAQSILAVLATERQKSFYDFVNINLKYMNIECETFNSIKENPNIAENKIFVIMDIPATFQEMSQLLRASKQSEQVLVVLLKQNKKYINMFNKKIQKGNYETILSQYSSNKLVGINQKLRQLVDKSYDMNRSAFYAYGAYINTFRANLLKFIFKTQAIDVAALAKSFGFTTPPKVKQGKFLKVDAYKRKLKEKLKEKQQQRKEQPENQEQKQQIIRKKINSSDKIKALAAKKTKIIMKQKQKTKKVIKNIKSQKSNKKLTQSSKQKVRLPKKLISQKK